MTVVRVYCGEKTYEVTGAGYAPHGDFLLEGQPVAPLKEGDLESALKAGLLCNNAVLRENAGVWEMLGDPTEGALVVAALKAGLAREASGVDEIPSNRGSSTWPPFTGYPGQRHIREGRSREAARDVQRTDD